MSDYVPGEKTLAVASSIRPSVAVEMAVEHGFYQGDYVVVAAPKTPFRPQMEEIRQVAETKWPDQIIVPFEDIVNWAGEGGPDLLTGSRSRGLVDSPLDPQRRAVLLINNGVFERQW